MSDVDEEDIPDRDTCQRLCEEFAAITGTDEACAQFFLQDRKWDLTVSVNAYFDTQKDDVVVVYDGPEVLVTYQSLLSGAKGPSNCKETVASVSKLKFITWNLDGLDERSLQTRTQAVCNIINSELADIVFLQELIPETYSVIEAKLSDYQCIPEKDEGYFTATLLRKSSITYVSHDILPFPGTAMGRSLLNVKVTVNGFPLFLMNTHLESTKDHKVERIKQLTACFRMITKSDPETTVVFAGDLNLRDSELDTAGGIPPDIEDLWVACGSRPECAYTWDLSRNTNRSFPGGGSKFARLRFDRVYFRPSRTPKIKPFYFGLIGIEKIKSCGRFPSDHWGIIVHLDVSTC